MNDGRSSLRLIGGTVLLHDGLVDAPLSILGSQITEAGGTDVDVSGHLVLPGIVDLRSSAWIAVAEGAGAASIASALEVSARELARHGVTTAWLSAGWMRGDPLASPEIAEAALATLPALAARMGQKLDLRLEVDTHLSELSDRLTRLITTGEVVHVSMLPLANLLKETPGSEPGAQAAWAHLRAMPRQRHDQVRAETLAKSASMPRHVCQVAAACDAAGIAFSSLYDRDAEAREYFRMLGARMADAPLSRTAAASAMAMGDPVLIEARDVIGPSRQQAWVGAGLVSALVSGDTPSSLLRAALALEAHALMPLEGAWSLISSVPARIAGLHDRGEIAVGKRADLVVLDRTTGHVTATLTGGQLAAGQGPVADALARQAGLTMAAE